MTIIPFFQSRARKLAWNWGLSLLISCEICRRLRAALSLRKNLILFCTATKTKFRTLIKEQGEEFGLGMRVRLVSLSAPPNNLRSRLQRSKSSGVSGLCERTYIICMCSLSLREHCFWLAPTRLDPGKSSYVLSVAQKSNVLLVMRPTISIWGLIKFSFGNSNSGKWVTAHQVALFSKRGNLQRKECSSSKI